VKTYRPTTVIVGVVFVLLGGLLRLADPGEVMDDQTRKLVHGSIGVPVSDEDFTLTVTRVKLARTVVKNESDDLKDALTTEGVFVAVEFDISGRHQPKTVGALKLETDEGSTYEPFSSPSVTSAASPAAGFTESQTALFEANPEDLAGLTLRITPTQLISYYKINYAIDLGIPSEDIADDLVAKASTRTGQEYVVPRSQLRVTP
jgi:hypothetical protein